MSAQGGRAGSVLAMATLLAGCAATVQTVAVATPEPDMPAYLLSGPSLEHLRAEAARRCPQGFQTLRSAASGERRGGPEDGMLMRWWVRGADVVAPSPRSAQLMVLCAARGKATDPAATTERASATGRGAGDTGTADAAPAAPLPAALAGMRLPPPSQAPVSGYD